MQYNLKLWTSNMTDCIAFQIIQYDFTVAPVIHYIRLKLYLNVLCCRHLQVADPSKNAHDNQDQDQDSYWWNAETTITHQDLWLGN